MYHNAYLKQGTVAYTSVILYKFRKPPDCSSPGCIINLTTHAYLQYLGYLGISSTCMEWIRDCSLFRSSACHLGTWHIYTFIQLNGPEPSRAFQTCTRRCSLGAPHHQQRGDISSFSPPSRIYSQFALLIGSLSDSFSYHNTTIFVFERALLRIHYY